VTTLREGVAYIFGSWLLLRGSLLNKDAAAHGAIKTTRFVSWTVASSQCFDLCLSL